MHSNHVSQSETFQINVPLKAHIQAEKFVRYQSQNDKARQVYLNTLAVATVNSYLNLIGWSTSLEESDSWNPAAQMIMDVADLKIPSYGKLECRAVLAGQERVIIPPEVWSERIGYVVVMLDQHLKQGTLLGFVRQVNQIELPISQLESLAKFPTYLCQQKRAASEQVPSLSSWVSGALNRGWQQLDELLPSQMKINFRNGSELDLPDASKVKLVQLGKDTEQTIALVLNIRHQSESEFKVSVRVCNHRFDNYLPEGLELVITDQIRRPVMVAQASETETIEFVFSGELGEKFSVEVSLDQESKVENFTI
ncbi:MAG: DUF1822 family protein [Cyanobacteria bacterium J06621_8]